MGGEITVTVEFDAGYPDGLPKAQSFSETVALPVRTEGSQSASLVDRAKFSILIFKPEGRQASQNLGWGYAKVFGYVWQCFSL